MRPSRTKTDEKQTEPNSRANLTTKIDYFGYGIPNFIAEGAESSEK